MNVFEKKEIEVDVLKCIASECERHIEWYMDYDEEGKKCMPSDERNMMYIEKYKELMAKLEKML